MDSQASVIVSVYRDVDSLRCILVALQAQTERHFEVLVSEDGDSREMRGFVESIRSAFPNLMHLSQQHRGFGKNRALNQAVRHARSSRLIFLDGDCVPHRCFVENHLSWLEPGVVCIGRRAEMGKRASRWIRQRPARLFAMENPILWLLLAPVLCLDGLKHFDAGLASATLHRLNQHKPKGILGCNFSCCREDLLRINGFNEDYVQPGVGEDTDLQWRLERVGVRMRNIRFLVPVYHLDHPVRWQPSRENGRILETTVRRDDFYCENGIERKAVA